MFALSLPHLVYLEFNPLNADFGANMVLAVLDIEGIFEYLSFCLCLICNVYACLFNILDLYRSKK